MTMRIQNNIESLNAYRNLNTTNRAMSRSLERLSSGYRINRAADDAAGLAISEKMRSQIRGLNQAVRNAQDGISLIQTAEGALNETHSILQAMRELANQSANDTYTADDRAAIQQDINQLVTEITRIGETTEFNSENLLDGSYTGKLHIGANAGQDMDISIGDMRADALNVAGDEAATFDIVGTVTAGDEEIADGTYDVVAYGDYQGEDISFDTHTGTTADDVAYVMVDGDGNAIAVSDDGESYVQVLETEAQRDTIEFSTAVTDGTITVSGTEATASASIEEHGLASGTYTIVSLENNSMYSGWDYGLENSAGEIVALGAQDTSGGAATELDGTNGVQHWVDPTDTSVSLLDLGAQGNHGLEVGESISVSGAGLDVSSRTAANDALTVLDNAIEAVSSQRSMLGALQNRLEHTITNLEVASENLTAAESRIRDVDMAAEMTEFTKNQILTQAGTAMLAQANMAPQAVLQLLG